MTTIQERALLDTIRYAEGTWRPDGYQVMFGGGKTPSLERHPNRVIRTSGYSSAAAGAYQFLPGTWDEVQQELGLKDFGPRSQDLAALKLVERRGARGLINTEGFTPDVAAKLAPEWASFPTMKGTSYYGQPVKKYSELKTFYDSRIPALSKGGGAPAPAPVTPSPSPPENDSFTRTLLKSMLGGGDDDTASSRPITSLSAPRNRQVSPFTSALLGGGVAGAFAPLVGAIAGLNGRGGAERPQGAGQEAPRMAAGGFFPSLVQAILSDSPEASPAPAAPAAAAATGAPPAVTRASGGGGAMVKITDVGKMLQGAGLRVREHPDFGGVGGHSKGSLHYDGKALDITDWQDPGESQNSWLPRKKWYAQQVQNALAGTGAEVFGPHNDPRGHGSHIHLGLPSGSLPAEAAARLVELRQQSFKQFPLRWKG
jgi:muramidase (phage lysozyme)